MVVVEPFSDDDPGLNAPAESLFQLSDEFIAPTFGSLDVLDGREIERFRNLVPATVALGVETCLRRCGITKN